MRRVVTYLAALVCLPSSAFAEDCPSDMVKATDTTCIDRFEWPNVYGGLPSVALSGLPEPREAFMDADALCSSIGKRVCQREEWVSACLGMEGTKFPYGRVHEYGACNSDLPWRAFDEVKVHKRDSRELSRLNQSSPSGTFAMCVSESGAQDMVGNVEEWVLCPEGRFGWCLVGGFWSTQKASCLSSITNHSPFWHFYQVGTRCCADIGVEL